MKQQRKVSDAMEKVYLNVYCLLEVSHFSFSVSWWLGNIIIETEKNFKKWRWIIKTGTVNVPCCFFSLGNNQEITYGFEFSSMRWQNNHTILRLHYLFVCWRNKERTNSFYFYFSLLGRHLFQFCFLENLIGVFRSVHSKCFSRQAKWAPVANLVRPACVRYFSILLALFLFSITIYV